MANWKPSFEQYQRAIETTYRADHIRDVRVMTRAVGYKGFHPSWRAAFGMSIDECHEAFQQG
jgi:hypothetical protein